MVFGQLVGLLAAGVAFVASLALVPLLRWVALRTRVVDCPGEPGGRKTQREPVPLLGGVAVLLGAMAGIGVAWWFLLRDKPVAMTGTERVLLAGGLMFLIGLIDDIFKDQIGPLPKFIGQFFAVVVLLAPSFRLMVSGGATPGGVVHLLCITLWFLTVVNAVNFVDNMNGLCSGLSTISLLVGLFGLSGSSDVRYALMAGGLGGALAGFLPHNYPKARIYLGDAGSHLAGFFLGVLSLEFTGGFMSKGSVLFGLDAFVPAMLVLGLPLFDLLFSVVRRKIERRPVFHGDARHLSHRLVGAGLDAPSAVMLLWGVHLILTAWGVVALRHGAMARYGMVMVVLVFLGILAAILVRVERSRNPSLALVKPESSSSSPPVRSVKDGTNGLR